MNAQVYDYWLAQRQYVPQLQYDHPSDMSCVSSICTSPVSTTTAMKCLMTLGHHPRAFTSLTSTQAASLDSCQVAVYPSPAAYAPPREEVPLLYHHASELSSADTDSPYCSPRQHRSDPDFSPAPIAPPHPPPERVHTTSGVREPPPSNTASHPDPTPAPTLPPFSLPPPYSSSFAPSPSSSSAPLAVHRLTSGRLSQRRRAQNRAAQRAFRERKEQHARELEARLAALTAEHAALEARHRGLEGAYDKLRRTFEVLASRGGAGSGQRVGGVEEGVIGKGGVVDVETLGKLLDILHEGAEVRPSV